ncbi:serine hydrolase domain-containing protein [Runella slithyformis]|uniref:Beta-lactamase n=1 Tax=Runella slithyformis (strain ATCC 29530 / DSM 19594 / LMG 11500 / NCIMB 11436 / LSU 4) TaxID=761193 RepID=A0A7U4E9C7_RUNSL|nr:serine hydrolase domain-containing protein [Runella slithyformis]AEI52214.1 beta-lactamase [Runella slithyformis DSM 19594]
MKKTITFCTIFWLVAQVSFAQTNSFFVKDSLGAYIQKSMAQWNIPGLALAITQGDVIIYSKAFGVLKKGATEPVNSQTLFPIGSMGKSFTAFSLAMLDHQQKLSLDDKVKKWLPWFSMKDKDYEKELRVKDILSHRTGMETFQGDLLWTESSLSNRAIIEKWGKFKPSFPIRSNFGYCNIGYMIAGEVIKANTGLSWQQYTQQNILNPLGMKNSFVEMASLKNKPNVAVGHTITNNQLEQIPEGTGVMQAFGGMYSNLEDIARWLMLHTNDGRIDGKQLFPERLIWNVRNPFSIVGKQFFPQGNMLTVNYGLGWDMVNYYNQEIVSHGGAYSGFLSMMGFVPNKKMGFVILTNSDSHEFTEALRWTIIDSFLGVKTKNYSEEMFAYIRHRNTEEKKIMASWKDSVNVLNAHKISLKPFEGRYQNDIYGNIELKQQENKLLMKMEHHPSISATLSYMSNDRFLCEYNHPMFGTAVIPFSRVNGNATGLTLSVHPSLEYTTYSFIKIK